jgi:PAS domain S-box-containing protein
MGMFLFGVVYVGGMVTYMAVSVARSTGAAMQGTEELAREFEALGIRADSLNRGLAELSAALRAGEDPPDRMIARGWVAAAEDRAIAAVAALPDITPEMRRALVRAGDLESAVVGLLNEALAQYERGLSGRAQETVEQAGNAGGELSTLLIEAEVEGLRLLLNRQEEAAAAGERLRNLALFWALMGAVLTGSGLVWLNRRVYDPLKAVERGLTRVGAGRYDTPVPVVHQDELGRLAEILNWATESLQQRTEANARVTQSLQERMGRLMEDSGREIYIFHAEDLHLMQMNGTLRDHLGWTEEDLGSHTPLDFVLPASMKAFRDNLDALKQGEIPTFPFAIHHLRGNGSTYPVEGNVQFSGDEEPPVFVAVSRDMTEIYDREDRLRQAMKMQAVGQLTGGVAHDFNNLLTVIQGSLDLLEVALPADDPQLGLLRDAMAAAERGGALTHQLLAFSRKQALRPRKLDLNQLVEDMDLLLRRTLGEDVEIEFVRGVGLWRTQADPAELQNVILNLALNARDAMPWGGKLTIETGNVHLGEDYAATHDEVHPGEYVLLAVTDTGRGMSPEILSRAFDPFFTTKGVGQGSGLGLSMAFGFAKQSGGHIKLYSEEKRGTTVRVYLPRLASGQMDLGAEGKEGKGAQPVGGGEWILVVEDDEDVLETAILTLKALGYETRSAREVDGALEILRANPPGTFSLLFTDVVLPGGKSGRDLAEEATQYDPSLPVLFTSGYTETSIIHHGRLETGVHLIEKPYRVEQLARKVKEVMGKMAEQP